MGLFGRRPRYAFDYWQREVLPKDPTYIALCQKAYGEGGTLDDVRELDRYRLAAARKEGYR